MPFRMSKSAAVLCIAIAVFATVVSAIELMPPALVISAAWQLTLPAAVVAHHDDALCDEQTAALLSLLPSRAPPRSVPAA